MEAERGLRLPWRDGTQLLFYGVLRANIRVRDVKVEEAFVISQINEDAILGMPFLRAQGCAMDFGRPVLRMGDRELVCTDRHERVLVSRVQLLREVIIPPNTEMLIRGRLNTRSHPDLGLIEPEPDGPIVAASLSKPDTKGLLLVRCNNPTSQPLKLSSGITLGSYTGVDDEAEQVFTDVLSHDRQVKGDLVATLSSGTVAKDGPDVPRHLQKLYNAAIPNCTKEEAEGLAQLLRKYSTVFSTGDWDAGKTDLITHSIPVMDGTRPIRQYPHRLGSVKETEAERQVATLLEKGLIAPADGAWSSPVVLVKKKDSS